MLTSTHLLITGGTGSLPGSIIKDSEPAAHGIILMAGIEAIVVGALLLTLARQNQRGSTDSATDGERFSLDVRLLCGAAPPGGVHRFI